MKEKRIDELDFIKIKNSCAKKDTIKSEKETYRIDENTWQAYI